MAGSSFAMGLPAAPALAAAALVLALLAREPAPAGAQAPKPPPPEPAAVRVVSLAYAPAPPDNPLRGLVPYMGDRRDHFPHSMEFNYVALAALLVGEDRYDWSALERLLDAAGSRGHQAVFRVYMEFPGRRDGIPQHLRTGGLKVHRYLNTNTQPNPPTEVETPDYENPRLRQALVKFIAALGAKYDGDPRVGFISAGLLGTWGEWHTWPREDLWASKAVQREVLDAYEKAFRVTPVLLRYPARDGHMAQASNVERPFGYHDDSFAWATIRTGREEDDWFFMALLHRAGPKALERWKTRPIGGEIRPEAWGKVFDDPPGDPKIQDFVKCVEETHASWMMDSGLFLTKPSPQRRARALALTARLGYEFHVASARIGLGRDRRLHLGLTLENRGVAPFYYDWRSEAALLKDGRAIASWPLGGKLVGLLPGEGPRVWEEALDLRAVGPGSYRLALRTPNPLPRGRPIRYANAAQDRDAPGYLTLGDVELP